jgi:hypothetical protein
VVGATVGGVVGGGPGVLVGGGGTLVGATGVFVDSGALVAVDGGLVGVDVALATPVGVAGPGVLSSAVVSALGDGLGVIVGVDVGASVTGVPGVGDGVLVDVGVVVGDGVTVGEAVVVGVGVGDVAASSNCAMTAVACWMRNVHVVGGTPATAAHEGGASPLQPANTEPLSGVANSVTCVPTGTAVEHPPRHCKPAGATVTEPDPACVGLAA